MLSPYAVYTILSRERLDRMAEDVAPVQLQETKRWVTAKKLFDAAHDRGEDMPVLFADDGSKLLYWGTLSKLEVNESGTAYVVRDLVPLRRRTQDLVLQATDRNIAEGFIRPYAVVHTPSFLKTQSPQLVSNARQGITLFSFGYWGSGSATPHLVEAFDQAEALRGFEPPLWVDIRIRRAVRAVGFRENAFGDLLGPRYIWMRDLGNQNVEDRRDGIKIKDPAAAEDLFNLALESSKRRVIFFCSCELPAGCHRNEVGRLVIKAAQRRGADVTVVEWPGDEPTTASLTVPAETVKKILRGTRTLPLPHSMKLGEAAKLPWASDITLEAPGAAALHVLLGPAQFDSRGTNLRVMSVEPKPGDALKLRNKRGYVERSTTRRK